MQKIAAAISVLSVACVPLQATTIHVPADQPTIQAGIDAAVAGDEVIVAEGTYTWDGEGTGFESVYGLTLIQMKSGVTLRSETGEASCVTIDAQGQGRIILCEGVDSGASIIGFTIANGASDDGGGIYCIASHADFSNCIILSNSASDDGGGVYCYESSFTFSECTFSENSASDYGGGIQSRSSSVLIGDCTFMGNMAHWGGGVSSYASTDIINNCYFVSNSAYNGGGICCHYHSTTGIENSTLITNSAARGGGICLLNEADVSINHCLIEGNTASSGGGIHSDWSSATISYCTVYRNSATNYGGGIYCDNSSTTISNCTICSNSANLSGGIHCYHHSFPDLDFCIIALSENGGAVNCAWDSEPDLNCCDVFGNVGGDWEACVSSQLGVNGNISEDPLFYDASNGDFHLLDDSPCAPENNDCGLMGAWPVGGENDDWPIDSTPPSLVLKIEEDSGEHKVHSVELSWELPHPSGRKSDSRDPQERIAEVVDGSGFVEFEVGTWGDWVRSIILKDIHGITVGHIGFKIDDSYDNQEVNAFVFLHDQFPGFPWIPGQDPPGWSPIHDDWNYYDEGESPVSMLVPPGFNIENVRQAEEKPVLFVHGIAGYINYWDGTPEASELPGDTYDTWRFCYPYDQPIQASGELLGKAIERLLHGDLVGVSNYQTERIDLVAHSMGGLVSRSWIQSDAFEETGDHDDPGNINSLLMFATPNHGSHISYRLYEEHVPFEDIGEVFSTHDAEAPAHRQMIPASSWVMGLNSIPLRNLGRGSINMDYLVVTGTKDIITFPAFNHTEITNQDDGVVAVSSASLLRYGVPLALVDEEHRDIHKANQAALVISSFLSSDYNPSEPSFTQGSDPWVFDYISEINGNAYRRTEAYDASAGILQFHMPWIDDSVRRYAIHEEGTNLLIYHNMHSFIFTSLQKHDGDRFFSRAVSDHERDIGIGFRVDAGDYTVQIYRKQPTSWWDWLLMKEEWVLDGTCPGTVQIDPLCTTSETLPLPIYSILAYGAPNSTPMEPTGRRSYEYGFFIDTSIDTVIFSLSSLEASPDYYQHEMILEDPYGRIIDPAEAQSDPLIGFFENLDFGPIQYIVEYPAEGAWLVRHDNSILSPIVMSYTYGSLTSELSIQPDIVEEGDTIICKVQISGVEAYPSYDLALYGYITYPDSANSTPLGEIPIADLGDGSYEAELLEVVAGEYFFHLILNCATEVGDTIQLSDSESAYVTTDATPTQPDDGPDDGDGQSPDIQKTQLLGAWPNPFNPSVKIELYSEREQRIRVAVFDITGRRIRQLLDKEVPAGRLSVDWGGIDENENTVPSGVYLIQFQAKGVSDSRKVVLLK